MALYQNKPMIREVYVHAFTASVAATPVAALARIPIRGRVVKVGSCLGAAITVANASIAVALISGGVSTAVGGSPYNIIQAGSAAGQVDTLIPSSPNLCNEDDAISFTPSGASSANVPCMFFAVIETQ